MLEVCCTPFQYTNQILEQRLGFRVLRVYDFLSHLHIFFLVLHSFYHYTVFLGYISV